MTLKIFRTFEEDEKIFKEIFTDFNMPIELKRSETDSQYVNILFHCPNIQEYISKSGNIENMVYNKSSMNVGRKIKFSPNSLKFVLDNLTIDDIKDSYFDYMQHSGGVLTGHHSYPVAVRRRDFTLSDPSGKILSYVKLDRDSPNDKTWSTVMYSEKGDEIRVTISSLEPKEDEKNINVCESKIIRNYSLEGRLNK